MFGLGDIILISWAVYLFYWIINWKKVKPSKEKKFDLARYRALGIIFVIVIIVVSKKFNLLASCRASSSGCIYSNIFSPQHALFALQLIGVLLTVTGVVIAVLARRTLADNWSNTVELKKGHELVTKGVYGYVRHPIYLGIWLMALGTVMYVQSVIVFLIFLFLFGVFALRIGEEEKLMTQTFPKEYPEYKKRVKTIIPFIW